MSTKTFLDVRYPALDQQKHCLIVDLIESHDGTVVSTDPITDEGCYEICGCFPDSESAKETTQALKTEGIEYDLRQGDDDDDDDDEFDEFDEPEAGGLLVIQFDSGRPWVPRKIVEMLSFDLCLGWSYADDRGPTICVGLRSAATGRCLKHAIENSLPDGATNCFFVAKDVPETKTP